MPRLFDQHGRAICWLTNLALSDYCLHSTLERLAKYLQVKYLVIMNMSASNKEKIAYMSLNNKSWGQINYFSKKCSIYILSRDAALLMLMAMITLKRILPFHCSILASIISVQLHILGSVCNQANGANTGDLVVRPIFSWSAGAM